MRFLPPVICSSVVLFVKVAVFLYCADEENGIDLVEQTGQANTNTIETDSYQEEGKNENIVIKVFCLRVSGLHLILDA